MKKSTFILLLTIIVSISLSANPKRFFQDKDLTLTGTYYYPEHWPESQWARDFKNIKDLGFEFVHFAEFAWAQIEPSEGEYDFSWLDKAVDMANKEGLKIIMCTSTATPPVWLIRKHPETTILREDGTKWDHGSRQHPSVSNPLFRSYALKTIEKLAQHYGSDKRIMGWQLDNEPRVSADYSEEAHKRFRVWVQNRYQDINQLNKAWGTAFWSQVYSSFNEINIPRVSQQFMNTHQILDFQRFITEEMASFLDEQARVIKKYANSTQWITSNYIPTYSDGHIKMSPELDFHCYTRYMVFGENFGIGRKGYRVGHVERIAKANDYFRPIDGTYGVMELQPGQVNWGQINPQPLPGAVRLWLWHVFAGGSKFTCTYRYRQPLYGTELYHYGIVGPDGVTPTPGGLEFSKFIKEIELLRKEYNPKIKNPSFYEQKRTAILYNPENTWEIEKNKQTTEWDTEKHIDKYYDALKKFGCPVDFIEEKDNFINYKYVVAPAYEMVDDALVSKWTEYVKNGGNLILSARSGHKNKNGQLWEALFGEPIYSLIGGEIKFYDLLLPHTPDQVEVDGKRYSWTSWGEILSPFEGTEVWGKYCDDFYKNEPAIIHSSLGKGSVTYIGVDSQKGDLEKAVLRKLYTLKGENIEELPDGVHIEYRDGFGIAVNYSDQEINLPVNKDVNFLIGSRNIQTAEVAVWKY